MYHMQLKADNNLSQVCAGETVSGILFSVRATTTTHAVVRPAGEEV